MTDPQSEYQRRRAIWSERVARGERTHLLISNARLGTAALAAIVAWLAFGRQAVGPWWFVAVGAAFLALIAVHALVLNQNDRAVRARRLYERGLDRLAGRWAGVGSDGARFLGDDSYARDLDLFGHASLFQLLTAAQTEAGEDTLADWLRTPAPVEEIRARQAAVEELRPRLDFREGLAVLSAEARVSRTSALAQWVTSGPVGLSSSTGVVLAAASAVMVGLAAAAFWSLVSWGWPIVWALVQAALAAWWRRPVEEVLHRLDLPAHELGLVRALVERIEREVFASPRLVALHERFTVGGVRASRAIARLERYISAADSAHNLLFGLIAYLLHVRGLAAVGIDRWHAAHGTALAGWLQSAADLEALSSFAAYAYEHPADPFPVMEEHGPLFDGQAIAHPLIAEQIAVPNDVRLGGSGPRVLIVSGSNMSGKSTLLRAVGVNAVLALAGAPVRAARLTLSPLAIGATLKVDDSLQAGHSRFYTEILRIRAIVSATRGPIPVLFLLDEILHGTNSYDRRVGAEAIVRALVEAGAIGLVTTHDLALTELVTNLGSRAANVHFADHLEDGKLVFDYRMRTGVVEHSNALALMRAVGLDV